MKRAFTEEQKQFINDYYPERGAEWVANQLGKLSSQIKTYASNHHLYRINFYHIWIESQLEKLTNEFPHRRTDLIAAELGLAYHVVSNQANRMKLKKTDVFLSSSECNRLDGRKGSCTRFEKGHTPANKGVTMSAELREKVKHTWFKPGYEPTSTKYDGYISTRINSHGHPYLYIRIEKGKFEILHRHNWKKVNGPIPEGMILRSKDGDSSNCDPDNWKLVDRAGHLGENSGREELTDNYILAKLTHRAPELKPIFSEMPELIELKRSQIKLKRTINELTETPTND